MEHIKGMYYKPEQSYEDLSREEQIREYIQSFKEPALNICRQLQEAFSIGKYSDIFGVDTSGRIPALIVYEFAKAVANHCGIPPPSCWFLPPVPDLERKKEIGKQLKNRSSKAPILMVDDTIHSGRSIADASEIVRSLEIPFDVAVFIAYNLDEEHLKLHQDYIQADNLYIGENDFVSDGVFDEDEPKHPVKNSSVNGVERLIGPLHLGSQETIILGDATYQKDVNVARAEVAVLTQEISNILLNK